MALMRSLLGCTSARDSKIVVIGGKWAREAQTASPSQTRVSHCSTARLSCTILPTKMMRATASGHPDAATMRAGPLVPSRSLPPACLGVPPPHPLTHPTHPTHPTVPTQPPTHPPTQSRPTPPRPPSHCSPPNPHQSAASSTAQLCRSV